jgi:hypothetical protein
MRRPMRVRSAMTVRACVAVRVRARSAARLPSQASERHRQQPDDPQPETE